MSARFDHHNIVATLANKGRKLLLKHKEPSKRIAAIPCLSYQQFTEIAAYRLLIKFSKDIERSLNRVGHMANLLQYFDWLVIKLLLMFHALFCLIFACPSPNTLAF